MKIISQRQGFSLYQSHLEFETFQEVLDFFNDNEGRNIQVYCKNNSNFLHKLKVDELQFIRNIQRSIDCGEVELCDNANWVYRDGAINIA